MSGRALEPIDFRLLFEASPRPFLVLLPDSPRFTIVAVSEAYLRATMTKREGIVGRGLFDVFPDNPDDPNANGTGNLRASLDRVVSLHASDTMAVQKYDIPRPNGGFEERYWSPLNAPVLNAHGQLTYIIHHVEDVTDFIRLRQQGAEQTKVAETLRSHVGKMEEEVFRRAQEIQDSNRQLRATNEQLGKLDELKSQFFANVSHELRTPLALILGPLEQLLGAANLAESQRRDLEVASRNARTLLKHVNDLLDVAKLEAGKMQIEYSEGDLTRVVQLVASHFEVLARERNVQFRVEAETEIPGQFDTSKLQRVLLNLVSNAFKFTPSGGDIRCTVRQDTRLQRAIVEVADSGPGIPASEREVIFERFRQLEGGSSRRFGGTGLGLPIARDLTELHGGTLTVDKAPEGGALFALSIPLRAPEGMEVLSTDHDTPGSDDMARAAVGELHPPTQRQLVRSPRDGDLRGTVLVVEDNPAMNRFIVECLAGDYRVVSAYDGKEGFEKALELRPDLIVSDIMMPKMSGDELLRAVRSHPDLSQLGVMLLTAKGDDELRVRLLRDGAQDFMMKPFSPEELRARAANLVSIKRARRLLQEQLDSRQEDLETLADEMKERKERAAFLSEASRLLGASLDLQVTLQRVATIAVPALADFCIVDLLQEDRSIERVAIAHADPGQEKLLIELKERFPPDWASLQPAVRVLHTGKPELLEEVTDTVLADHTRSTEHAALMKKIGVRAHIAVPLIARGQILGVLNLGSASPTRRYDSEDLSRAEDLAHRAALAIENARLYRQAIDAIRVREEFLSIASHELRTPLTPLQLQVGTLLARIGDLASGAASRAWIEERLERIARQGVRLERLVNQLLDVSRITGRGLKLDLVSVDLAELVREVHARLCDAGDVERSGCNLTMELSNGVIGRWDHAALEQIVENLILNALKYGAGRPVRVCVDATASTAILTVQDEGIGVAAEHQERIFGKFERAVSVRHYGGLGMGLFIVRQLTEALQGTVKVESAAQKGARFVVMLPLAGPAKAVAEQKAPGKSDSESASETRH